MGATTFTCPTSQGLALPSCLRTSNANTHAEYDKMVTPSINDVTWVYHTQSGVQTIAIIDRNSKLRVLRCQIKRSVNAISYICNRLPIQREHKMRRNLRRNLDMCSKTPNYLTIFSHHKPFSCLKTALNGLLAKKKKTPHRRVQLIQISVIGEFS